MPHQGLAENEVQKLREKFGENILPIKDELSWLKIFLSQFQNPLVYISVIVALISIFLKEYMDASLIGAVVVLNIFMGFYQEYSAEKTLHALRNIIKPKATVIRDGQRKEIEVKDLVPRDIILLSSGDRVPADGKLVEKINLLINEAILTGESEAVSKTIEEEIYMGTTVISGRGIMEVEKIGRETKIGQIGQSLAEIEKEKTPLQEKLEKFTRSLTYILITLAFFIFFFGLLYGKDAWQMWKLAVILAIAAIPSGLPIAVTVILALGIRKILKRKGLVKKLLSIETLGSTSVICMDKTGTLTEGIMQVKKTELKDKEGFLLALTLANNQKSNMEIALWDYVKKIKGFNPEKIFNSTERIYEEPFDGEKKYTLVVNNIEGKKTAFIMGAPEIVLSFCKISADGRNNILTSIDSWADEGLRLLGLATKEEDNLKEKNNYHWLGLVGIEDPLRIGAKEAIEKAQEAGIKIKIVTGDYRKTTERIAKNLGLKIKPENVMEGQELELISEEELMAKIDEVLLFTRVTPHQKLKIVKALQTKGEVVAMTGDGVNDAPALRKADIGVVVGKASDVAREAGDLILLDSNFATIVAAVEEGRLIFANIKKVVSYALSNSFVEVVLISGAIILNFPSPLTVVQILWIHLICDGPPDIILGFEPKEKDIMKEKPQNIQKEKILDTPMKFLIFTISLLAGLVSLVFFWYFKNKTADLDLARTLAFATVATIDLIYIFAFKNLKRSIIRTENFFGNKYLLWSVAYGFILVFLAIYLPPLNRILGTVPLRPSLWLPVFAVGIFITLLVEVVKLGWKKKKI
jgi:Ca2+-transporting ATPase